MPQDCLIPIGICQCGCGQSTNTVTRTNTKRGLIVGDRRRFVEGHQNRSPLTLRSCSVCGGEYRFSKGRREKTCGNLACKHESTSRSHLANSTVPDEKACIVCGVIFSRPLGTQPGNWRLRRTCSKECRYSLASANRLAGADFVSPYPPEFREVRERVVDRDGHACRLCGITTDRLAEAIAEWSIYRTGLAVHHIDYNKANCSEHNLITLCVVCHGKTSTCSPEAKARWQSLFEATVMEIYAESAP
jgi:rRNA maturation protein Nop10